MRAGYFGPEGTFTHEALLATAEGTQLELISFPTIYDTVMAVDSGGVDRALVPIENSLEGSVYAPLDALAMETDAVAILGEVVHPIRHCLIAGRPLELEEIEVVVSHPQATGQCARFIRTRLPNATVVTGASTADAVRTVTAEPRPWAALGNPLAADRYGGLVLRAGVEDGLDNETRFVWLGPAGARPIGPESGGRRWKTAIVFWGQGSDAPGWLVACLSQFAARRVNLSRIESRPLKQGLGRYMFFVDSEGRDTDPALAESLTGLREHVEVLRILGSFPAA